MQHDLYSIKNKHTRRRRHRRTNHGTCGSNSVMDPKTQQCIKLSSKGKFFDKYVIPYIAGQYDVLELFSEHDQGKFLFFLAKENLLLNSSTYNKQILKQAKLHNTNLYWQK